jgi:pimeloyl-ACP methyl ester carboxylesterase
MQRPVMDPTFVDDLLDSRAAQPRASRWWQLWRLLWRVARSAVSILLTDLMPRVIRRRLKIEDGTPLTRFVRGLLYRLAFLPILLVLIVATMVFNATHPPGVLADTDPTADAIYYEPLNFISDDGTRCEAWLVPVLDAKRVIAMKEEAVAQRQPSVLLVHDFGNSKQQMLPLVRPLHEAGMVVLVVGLRGSGTTLPAAQTFGLTEWMDIRAASEMLRHRPYVDANRIGVVGIGTGATAALLAAQHDDGLRALVLADPATGADEVVATRIAPHQPCLSWMRPVCKWSFEMAFGLDAEDLELRRFQTLRSSRPVIMLDCPRGATDVLGAQQIGPVRAFLEKHLNDEVPVVADSRSSR